MAIVAGLIVAAVSAVAAGASVYMQSEAQQQQAKSQRRMAQWQEDVEKQQAAAARKQVQLRSQRFLNAQAAKAGKAGVVAHEGSLLENQLEAASLAQYEEDLAAYGHELNSRTHGFEAKLFRHNQKSIEANKWVGVGLAAGSSAANSYQGYQRQQQPSGGKTVATSPSWGTGV